METAAGDVYPHIRRWLVDSDVYRLARSCRRWWQHLHTEWYRLHHRRRRWRQLATSLSPGGRVDEHMEEWFAPPSLPARYRRNLQALLAWIPELAPHTDDTRLASGHHFMRWVQLQDWVGAQVEAIWTDEATGESSWFDGTVAGANADGTFRVVFHDGDSSDCVPANGIRLR